MVFQMVDHNELEHRQTPQGSRKQWELKVCSILMRDFCKHSGFDSHFQNY